MIDTGRKVQLDALCKRDLELIRAWRNDPEVWKWCRQNDLISDFDQEKWFERQAQDPTIKMYAIRAFGDIVGVCGLTSIDLWNRRAEFSLYIQPKEMKKGYGKQALETLLDHAFNNLGLNVVWGETFEGNPAAQMFKEIGFKHEGTRREFYFKNGKFIDCDLYSMTARKWRACSASAICSA